jgi:hypothetical protein
MTPDLLAHPNDATRYPTKYQGKRNCKPRLLNVLRATKRGVGNCCVALRVSWLTNAVEDLSRNGLRADASVSPFR